MREFLCKVTLQCEQEVSIVVVMSFVQIPVKSERTMHDDRLCLLSWRLPMNRNKITLKRKGKRQGFSFKEYQLNFLSIFIIEDQIQNQ